MRTTTALLLLAAFSSMAISEIPVYKEEPSKQFLQSWLLCGPFPNPLDAHGNENTRALPGFYHDYLGAHGGETGLQVTEGQIETFDGGQATWIRHRADGYAVDLDRAISTSENVLAYAYCEIQSQEKQVCTLALGSNDGVRVWLNGEEIWVLPVGRAVKKDEDLIPVILKEGRNRLLLKVEESSNLWGFCARLFPLEPEKLSEGQRVFRVVTDKNGVPKVRFLWVDSVAQEVIEEAAMEVLSQDEPRRTVWHGAWPKTQEAAIAVPTDRYGEYLLRLRVTFAGGVTQTMEFPFTAGPRVEYTLFEDRQSDYRIVVGAEASESEKWAAQELRHWLREAGGADLTVVEDSGEPHGSEIVVGFNRHAQSLLGAEVKQPEALDESFTYKNVGPHVVLWGGRQRGTQYAVMTFLERELGCRWYTPRVSVVPQRASYRFHYLHHSEAPGLRVRNDFYYEAFQPIWAARNKINGAMNFRDQPGGVESYWAVHTFYRFMPPAEFFEAHPEYYSLIDGERIHERAQLCLTNPDVLRIATERIKRVMRDQPQYLIYSVSQNDCHNPCQCAPCQAIAIREESEAGPLIWFVNQVAEAVEEEFPDKFIGTLAYTYTRKPCKTIQPRENVVIRLCSIECCFAHDFFSCPENETFVQDIQGWAEIAPHLYIWDYVVNFTHYVMPFPNFRVLQPNLQTFRDHKAIGVMEQAAYQSRGGEFAELRMYLISKLLWNPECGVDEVIDDFMYGYYGRAGQHVRAYLDLLHGQLTPETHIHLGLKPDDRLFTDAFVREASQVFDRAEAVADNDEIRQRVEMARLPLLYLKCKRTPEEAVRDGSYGRFCEIAEREGVTHYGEIGEPHRKLFHGQMKMYEQ